MQENIGRYQVLKRLGGGGFGEVFLGHDEMIHRDVAIKVFKPKDENLIAFATSSSEEGLQVLRERFLNEARILGSLENAGYVVNVLDFGEMDDGEPYYVMPYLTKSLSDLIGKDVFNAAAIDDLDETEKPRALALGQGLEYIYQLIQAVAAAHKKQLIHRDIKPGNIMLNEDDEIRLVDFGIAKAPDGQHSTVSQLGMGSRNYMAPEQKESAKHVDARADVYAIGVVAYRVLTGRLPTGRFADPNVYATALSQGLNDLILDCVNETLDQRPSDASALLELWEKAAAQQNTPVNEDESTGTWVGESTSGLKDELKPLREYIVSLLKTHAEIPESEQLQLDAMAAVADLDEAGLKALIEECQQSLRAELKPKQNLLKLIDSKANDNTLNDAATRSAIYKAGETVGWSNEQLDTIIERKSSAAGKSAKPQSKRKKAAVKGNTQQDEPTVKPTPSQASETPEKKVSPIVLATGLTVVFVLAIWLGIVATTDTPEQKDQGSTAATPQDQASEATRTYPVKLSVTPSGADITIDGVSYNNSKQYPVGTYSIAVTKEGYNSYDGVVTVTNNMPTKRITLRAKPQEAATYGITVNTTPSDATVQILTIGPKYYPGIQVEPKQHTIKVSKAGYKTYKQSINVNEDQYLNVTLKKDPSSSLERALNLVSIPAGSFMMGSTAEDKEKPVRRVSVPAFKMMAYEVTRGQFQAFVADTGHQAQGCWNYDGELKEDDNRSWKNPGYSQSDKDPVACVNWKDAQAYIQWLNKKTGKTFRLPTEAEWEYAARARTTTEFSFGNKIEPSQANFDGNYTYNGSQKGRFHGKTMPVGSYQANAFGLYDMHGNVWEWTQDCWHYGYNNAPSDGRAWESANGGSCSVRVLRGGSWDSEPSYLRSANRVNDGPADRYNNSGFRLVQGG